MTGSVVNDVVLQLLTIHYVYVYKHNTHKSTLVIKPPPRNRSLRPGHVRDEQKSNLTFFVFLIDGLHFGAVSRAADLNESVLIGAQTLSTSRYSIYTLHVLAMLCNVVRTGTYLLLSGKQIKSCRTFIAFLSCVQSNSVALRHRPTITVSKLKLVSDFNSLIKSCSSCTINST